MKILATCLATGLLITGGFGAAALAQTSPAPAAAAPAPKLGPGVKTPEAGFEPAVGKFVVANPTPTFSDVSPYSSQTGPYLKLGQPVTLLAKVRNCDWFLVGRDGVGIGYVPRDLLKPAGG